MYVGLIFNSMPSWLAVILLQCGLIVFGMALDESYVNRATVLAGAFALAIHTIGGEGVWFPVAVYVDIGLIIGIYGAYAYIVDAYVGPWFRVMAFYLYSPLTVLLVIVVPNILFPVALLVSVIANVQLQNVLDPREPYYFGPERENAAVDSTSRTNSTGLTGGDMEPAGTGEFSARSVTSRRSGD